MSAQMPQDTDASAVVGARVLSAGVGSPQIITGNYSVLMASLNDVLTNTVSIAPDGDHPRESHIHLLVEPMWLDSVDPSYNNELWGQSIDAFPPAIQRFALENVKPTPVPGEKLNWGQVRSLRNAMLERIEKTPGFTVYKEGNVQKVEELPKDGVEKTLKIKFQSGKIVDIPFTSPPVVLDCSQRPRPASPALSGDPTVLYRYSREENDGKLKSVPIIAAGAGAQAAWILDKMGGNRTFSIGYNSTLDFRIANAVLGEARFTATDGNVSVKDSPLKEALERFADGASHPINYKKDDGTMVEVNVCLYPNNKATLISVADFPTDPDEARILLESMGVEDEDMDRIYTEISDKIAMNNTGLGLEKSQLAAKLVVDPPPPSVDVGFAVNATGWVALKDTPRLGKTDPTPFWGKSARVITGEELVPRAQLITPGSLLPGSGIPRMFAMKNQVREMRATAGEENTYDVRALAFTKLGFEKMCAECRFPPGFSEELRGSIKGLNTPDQAKPDVVSWILEKYDKWLDSNPPELPSSATQGDMDASALQAEAKASALEGARIMLDENVAQNNEAEERHMKSS